MKAENEARADRAAAVINAYREMHPDYRDHPEEPNYQAVTDLLADIRHYCQKKDIEFQSCIRISEMHYQEEK